MCLQGYSNSLTAPSRKVIRDLIIQNQTMLEICMDSTITIMQRIRMFKTGDLYLAELITLQDVIIPSVPTR